MGAQAAVMARDAVEAIPSYPSWEEELRLLAFAVWQRACCPDKECDRDCVEMEPWCHASCL